MLFKTLKKIGLKCTLLKLQSRIFSHDSAVNSACDRIGAYNYLKKYEYVLDKLNFAKEHSECKEPKKVWLFWQQGYQSAPELVRKCKDSVLQNCSNLEVVVLDNSSVRNYISIPSFIDEKHDRGIIPNAHFADYIRISLLSKYGGIWIDATAYLTNSLPDYIVNADLFCFKDETIGKTCASNWFIAGCKNHPFFIQMKYLLESYWEKENKLVSYSIFHLFWFMIIQHNDANQQIWDTVPYFPDPNCKILQKELFDTFSINRFEQIKRLSSIHKLTYKFSEEKRLIPNTFYQKITTELE